MPKLLQINKPKTLADVVKNDAAVGEGYAPIGYYANFVMRWFYR